MCFVSLLLNKPKSPLSALVCCFGVLTAAPQSCVSDLALVDAARPFSLCNLPWHSVLSPAQYTLCSALRMLYWDKELISCPGLSETSGQISSWPRLTTQGQHCHYGTLWFSSFVLCLSQVTYHSKLLCRSFCSGHSSSLPQVFVASRVNGFRFRALETLQYRVLCG